MFLEISQPEQQTGVSEYFYWRFLVAHSDEKLACVCVCVGGGWLLSPAFST